MREKVHVFLIVTTAILLAGCDRPPQPAARSDPAANDAAKAAGTQQVNEMMAATREEALEARVATLENQVDTLSAKVDTRADLGAALAVPAPPPPILPPPASPKSPVPPHLPYEPTTGAGPN